MATVSPNPPEWGDYYVNDSDLAADNSYGNGLYQQHDRRFCILSDGTWVQWGKNMTNGGTPWVSTDQGTTWTKKTGFSGPNLPIQLWTVARGNDVMIYFVQSTRGDLIRATWSGSDFTYGSYGNVHSGTHNYCLGMAIMDDPRGVEDFIVAVTYGAATSQTATSFHKVTGTAAPTSAALNTGANLNIDYGWGGLSVKSTDKKQPFVADSGQNIVYLTGADGAFNRRETVTLTWTGAAYSASRASATSTSWGTFGNFAGSYVDHHWSVYDSDTDSIMFFIWDRSTRKIHYITHPWSDSSPHTQTMTEQYVTPVADNFAGQPAGSAGSAIIDRYGRKFYFTISDGANTDKYWEITIDIDADSSDGWTITDNTWTYDALMGETTWHTPEVGPVVALRTSSTTYDPSNRYWMQHKVIWENVLSGFTGWGIPMGIA